MYNDCIYCLFDQVMTLLLIWEDLVSSACFSYCTFSPTPCYIHSPRTCTDSHSMKLRYSKHSLCVMYIQWSHVVYMLHSMYIQWSHVVYMLHSIYIQWSHVVYMLHSMYIQWSHVVYMLHSMYIQWSHVVCMLHSMYIASPDGWAVWSAVMFTRWWLLVDHCVLRNWDRILVRAVKGLISRAGMVSICPLLWQRDVKLQQIKHSMYMDFLVCEDVRTEVVWWIRVIWMLVQMGH